MDLYDKRLEILDKVIKLELTVDDLRRILMIFRFFKYRMETDGENQFDLYDEVLMKWLEYQYNDSLKMEGINCF
ncbi:MAG: hypothetical protein JSV25_09395 [Spirochaetota bacterium]|nr:MAG: hypothetical protein JSV25_09395 [Spirochaetota bacterium]